MGHRTYSYTVESSAAPARFIAAATDFTEKRLQYWPTIGAKRYAVHSVGDHVAEVDEGEGPVWARVRYEWTRDTVRMTSLTSNTHRPGDTWEMRVHERGDGGSRIDIRMDFNWRGLGLFAQVMGDLLGTERFFVKDMRKTVRIVEAEAAADASSEPVNLLPRRSDAATT